MTREVPARSFLWVVHYSALPTMSSGMQEVVSVRKQTGPQRVHKSRDVILFCTFESHGNTGIV